MAQSYSAGREPDNAEFWASVPEAWRAAAYYLTERRWVPIPIMPGTKRPGKGGVGLKGWEEITRDGYDLKAMFPEGERLGVGISLGAPSGGLIDIDLDCPEAIVAARHYLPPTDMVWGRASAADSHYGFVVDDPPAKASDAHFDPLRGKKKGAKLLELRSTGGQTLVPPTIVPGDPAAGKVDEPVVWKRDGLPAHIDLGELRWALGRVGAAALLGRYWRRDCRHDSALALAGGLYRSGWGREQVTEFVRVVCAVAGDEEVADRVRAADDTAAALREGGEATGWPTLAKILGDGGGAVVTAVRGWLGVNESIPFGEGPRAVFGDEGGEAADDESVGGYPPPGDGERWDDPHRFARFYRDERRAADGEDTLCQWRDEFHKWGGRAWRPLPVTELASDIAAHCRRVVEADYPLRKLAHAKHVGAFKAGLTDERPGKPPAMFPVTAGVQANVRLNLGGLVSMPDTGVDAPFWRGDAAGLPPPSEVVAAPNGLFTIEDIAQEKGPFMPPSPRYFSTNALEFPVVPDAPLPRVWMDCLKQWLEDPAAILGLQEWMGYCLSTETRAQKIAFLIGPKRSGKGTVTRMQTRLIGEGNVASTTFAQLNTQFGLQPLLGKQLAVIPDARLTRGGGGDVQTVVERLLSISGEDQQCVDRKFMPLVSTYLKTRFLLSSNELPALPDAAGALPSRFLFLSFPNSWYGREDTKLGDKLAQELPGILQWACRGYVRLKCNGFSFTQNEVAKRYMREMEDLASPVSAFIRERCTVSPKGEVRCRTLYDQWCDWCDVRGLPSLGEPMFAKNLYAAFPTITKHQPRIDGGKVWVFRGVGLRDRKDWGEPDEGCGTSGTGGTSISLFSTRGVVEPAA